MCVKMYYFEIRSGLSQFLFGDLKKMDVKFWNISYVKYICIP